MTWTKIVLGAVGLASTVAAHGYVERINCQGKNYPTWQPYDYERNQLPTVVWPNDEANTAFITPDKYNTPDIVCHKNSERANSFLEVEAGNSINLKWTDWPVSHVGPVLTYLANARGEFSQVDKVNLLFVKIEEAGLLRNSSNPGKPEGYYAANRLMDQGDRWTVTIPKNVAPGNYVLRHEIIALMEAADPNKAQHYPQCINIKVTGNGKDPIATGTRARDFYYPEHPGILVQIYKEINYIIPGPPLYTFDGAPVKLVKKTSETQTSSARAKKSSVGPSKPTSTSPSPAESTTVPPVVVSTTSLIGESTSVPVRFYNATHFPEFVRKPSKTQPAASTPTPSNSDKPVTEVDGQADSAYEYDFSGFTDGTAGTESDAGQTAPTEAPAPEQKAIDKSASLKPATDAPATDKPSTEKPASEKPATDKPSTEKAAPEKPATEEPTAGKAPTPQTYSYNDLAETKAPAKSPAETELSEDDFKFPKNASVEELVAFLEKLVQTLKEKVLGGKRKNARDFTIK